MNTQQDKFAKRIKKIVLIVSILQKHETSLIVVLLLACATMLPSLVPKFISPVKIAAAQTPQAETTSPAAPKAIITIGILAERGYSNVFKQWQATADYLTAEVPGYSFEILALNFEQTYQAVKDGTVDFVIANSGMYVDFEIIYDANRIATLKNLRLGNSYIVSGGVIFRRQDREDIQVLKDLKGKTMMAVNETSLGGWQMQLGELKKAGMSPSRDLKELSFGDTHDNVVYAVQDGKVDVGAVRTDTLERMAKEDKINLDDFVVINQKTELQKDFPFLLSTDLYPELPFAATKNTPNELSEKVAAALLRMPKNSEAAKAAKAEGWTVPLNYRPVDDLFLYLQIGPYESLGQLSFGQFVQKYWYWFTIGGVSIIVVVALIIIYQQQRASRELEGKVQERTSQLAQANEEIIALNEKLKEENLRLGAELDVARQLQQMVLPNPEELDSIKGIELAGFMEPADEVGGDYYDVLRTDDVVTIAIGDVTGHGLESGILMLMTQTAVRTLQEIKERDPVRFLDTLNRTIYKNVQRMKSEKNLTLAVLNYSQSKVSISGQHEETLVVRLGGQIEHIDTMDLGLPIGMDNDIADYINHTFVDLNPGDGVVLYTDGIPEAFDINKKQYGMERLCEVISHNWQHSAQQIKQAVIDDVRKFIGGQKVFDDITLVVLKQQ